MERHIPTFEERLQQIVNISYNLLCNKIVGGEISIFNEASLQHQLCIILKQIGIQYLFSNSEHFSVDLEKQIPMKQQTIKSPKTARCDIWLSMWDNEKKTVCAIEVKFFKYNKATEATTDNRFYLLLDLENLEQYKNQAEQSILCYSIVYTNNGNYSKETTSSVIKLSPYITQHCERELTKYIKGTNGEKIATKNVLTVNLSKEYNACWDCYNSHYFLKIDMNEI